MFFFYLLLSSGFQALLDWEFQSLITPQGSPERWDVPAGPFVWTDGQRPQSGLGGGQEGRLVLRGEVQQQPLLPGRGREKRYGDLRIVKKITSEIKFYFWKEFQLRENSCFGLSNILSQNFQPPKSWWMEYETEYLTITLPTMHTAVTAKHLLSCLGNWTRALNVNIRASWRNITHRHW